MRNNNCILNLLKVIDLLQRNSANHHVLEEGCARPFLGAFDNNLICYNTRPISLYTKDGSVFSFLDTTFFRIERVKDNCVTLQALKTCDDGYIATREFITIDTNCFCVVRCFPDTFIPCL